MFFYLYAVCTYIYSYNLLFLVTSIYQRYFSGQAFLYFSPYIRDLNKLKGLLYCPNYAVDFVLHSLSLREICRISPSLPRDFNMVPDCLSYFSLFIFQRMRMWEQKIARVLWSTSCLLRNEKTKKGRITSQIPLAPLSVCPF